MVTLHHEAYMVGESDSGTFNRGYHCNSPLLVDVMHLVSEIIKSTRKTTSKREGSEPDMRRDGRKGDLHGVVLEHTLGKRRTCTSARLCLMFLLSRSSAQNLMSVMFDVLIAARHDAHQIEVAAYSLGHRVFGAISLGVMLGFTRTSMEELDAAAKLQTRLEGMDVVVHPRALQYAKTGSVLPCLFHKINAVERVTPTSSPPLLGDNDTEVMQRCFGMQTSSFKVLVVMGRCMFVAWSLERTQCCGSSCQSAGNQKTRTDVLL